MADQTGCARCAARRRSDARGGKLGGAESAAGGQCEGPEKEGEGEGEVMNDKKSEFSLIGLGSKSLLYSPGTTGICARCMFNESKLWLATFTLYSARF